MSRSDMRRIANRVRYMDLEVLVKRLGARPDKYDPHKWHTSQGTISINGLKFINWDTRVGGGGAIDLVMHIARIDFKSAILWLSQCPVTQKNRAAVRKSQRKAELKLPQSDPKMRRRVRDYLTKTRKLNETVIDLMMHAGNIYADARGNAVFLLLGKDKKPVGAELRGTSHIIWKGIAPGSRKHLGYFVVYHTDPHNIILCESAIDAISCFCLHPESMTISTSGATPNPKWLPSLWDIGVDVYCGFDADDTGDNMANKMMRLFPRIMRYRPKEKDWNLMWIENIKRQQRIPSTVKHATPKDSK